MQPYRTRDIRWTDGFPIGVLAVIGILMLFTASCSSERTYEVQGRVVGFGDDDRTLIVEHGAVDDLMPAMTMPFTTPESAAVASINTGDAVSFRLHLRGDSSWIEDISRLPDDAVAENPASSAEQGGTDGPPLLKAGDPVPDTPLISHADTSLSLADFRGQAVVVTFIYTRCPLPDYCPRMTQHLSRLQRQLESSDVGPVHLVSISFDPEHDTPSVLRNYARENQVDLSTWTFATGDSTAIRTLAQQFGVYFQTEENEIVHNLSTALIGEDGRVRRIWRGNEWTADDIFRAIEDMTMFQSRNA